MSIGSNLQTAGEESNAWRARSRVLIIATLLVALTSACDKKPTGVLAPTEPRIVISPPSETLEEGGLVQLHLSDENNPTSVVDASGYSWSTTDSSLFTISSTGVALGIRAGTATVIARSLKNNFGISMKLTVKSASSVPSVLIKSSSAVDTMSIGSIVHLTAEVRNSKGVLLPNEPLQWFAVNPGIAPISQSGDVTAFQTGSTAFFARWGNGASAKTITIIPNGALAVVGGNHLMKLGETISLQFTATPFGAAATAIPVANWSSDYPSIISVDRLGQVTAYGAGEGTITAQFGIYGASIRIASYRPIAALGLFAFVRSQGADSHLEIMNEAGTTLLSVHPSIAMADGYLRDYDDFRASASLSPDGQTFVYDCVPGVCSLKTGTGETRQLKLNDDHQASWSSDGSTLVMRHEYASVDLLNLSTDGAPRTRSARTYVSNPSLAANGRDVLYQCDVSSPYEYLDDICRADSKGVAGLYRRYANALSFSPVDSTTAFVTWIANKHYLVIEPYRTAADPDGVPINKYAGYEDVTETAWSPDGKRLALVRKGELWIVDMPDLRNAVRVAYVPNTVISSISWR